MKTWLVFDGAESKASVRYLNALSTAADCAISWILLKPIADHFGSFNVPDSVLLLIVFLTAIYAFRHVRRLAACLVVLAAISLMLRFAAPPRGALRA